LPSGAAPDPGGVLADPGFAPADPGFAPADPGFAARSATDASTTLRGRVPVFIKVT
jgi:hypothetical protein